MGSIHSEHVQHKVDTCDPDRNCGSMMSPLSFRDNKAGILRMISVQRNKIRQALDTEEMQVSSIR